MKKRILTLVLAVMLALGTMPLAYANRGDAGLALDRAMEYYQGIELTSWWEALAIYGAVGSLEGFEAPELPHPSEEHTASNLAIHIFMELAFGRNPAAYEGSSDLPEKLISLQEDGGSFGAIGAHVYAMLALRAAERDDYDLEAALKWLLQQQLEDGGFAYAGDAGDPDVTGMALLVLGLFREEGSYAEEEINRALAYLEGEQTENGGFVSPWSTSGAENAATCATVLSGLMALGVDEETKALVDELTDHLLDYQLEDGSFCYEADGDSDLFSTAQAAIALGDVVMGTSIFDRLERPETPPVEDLIFSDEGDIAEWALPYVKAMHEKGFMIGAPQGFLPERELSRAEFAVILQRILLAAGPEWAERITSSALEFHPEDLGAVPPDAWYYEAAAVTVSMGLLKTRDGTFSGEASITNGEMADALAIALGLDAGGAEHDMSRAIAILIEVEVLEADEKGQFQAGAAVSRQNAAKSLWSFFELLGDVDAA